MSWIGTGNPWNQNPIYSMSCRPWVHPRKLNSTIIPSRIIDKNGTISIVMRKCSPISIHVYMMIYVKIRSIAPALTTGSFVPMPVHGMSIVPIIIVAVTAPVIAINFVRAYCRNANAIPTCVKNAPPVVIHPMNPWRHKNATMTIWPWIGHPNWSLEFLPYRDGVCTPATHSRKVIMLVNTLVN